MPHNLVVWFLKRFPCVCSSFADAFADKHSSVSQHDTPCDFYTLFCNPLYVANNLMFQYITSTNWICVQYIYVRSCD